MPHLGGHWLKGLCPNTRERADYAFLFSTRAGAPTTIVSSGTSLFLGFLDDACTVGDFAEARFADLRRAYEEWCQANGHRAIGGNNFTNALKERGFTNRKGPKGARIWTGVGLQAPDGWEAHP